VKTYGIFVVVLIVIISHSSTFSYSKSSGRGDIPCYISTRGTIKDDGTRCDGGLTTQEFESVLKKNFREIENCKKRVNGFNDRKPGELLITVSIGAKGQASNVSVKKDTTGFPELAQCLLKRIVLWTWREPRGGGAEFTYHFLNIKSEQ